MTSTSTIGDGVGAYWKYEKWLRRHERAIRSTLGATGAIYALRRSLWQPLPAETLLDDVLAPMRAVLSGWRVVFEEEATAEDRTAPDAAAEARRKRRTLAGNYQILAQEPRLLAPFANPVWLQYLSHKVGRLLVPWALLGAVRHERGAGGRAAGSTPPLSSPRQPSTASRWWAPCSMRATASRGRRFERELPVARARRLDDAPS